MKLVLLSMLASLALASPARATWNFTADVEVNWVAVSVPRELAAGLLPAPLDLVSPDEVGGGIAADQYPLVFFFNSYANAHFEGLPDFIGKNYDEFILAVPMTRVRGMATTTPFGYMVKNYLSKSLPVFLGKFLYRFRKEKAVIHRDSSAFEVLSNDSSQDFVGNTFEFDPDAPFRPASEFPNLTYSRQIMDFPLIAVDKRNKITCASFDWNFAGSEVLPVRSSVELKSAFVSGLSAPMKFQTAGVDEDLLGSFRIKGSWKFSLPHSCDRYRSN